MRLLLYLMPFILVLVGCASPKPTFYSFNAIPIPQAIPTSKNTRIMVGPVTLPAIYDRPQLVMKNANNTVQAYEYHRWASSLKGDIANVVGSNIAITLKISNVWSFSQSMQSNFDYQVFLDVQNIENKAGEVVVVDVLWSIKPSNNIKTPAKPSANVNATTATNVIMGRSLIREPITEGGLNALVAAQSRAFSKVGQEIARSIP
jgi:uncharacterized lipoprotein YmbA